MKTLTLDTPLISMKTSGLMVYYSMPITCFIKKNIKGAINDLLPLLFNMGLIFYSHAIFSLAFGS